jgi:hypothetical protein
MEAGSSLGWAGLERGCGLGACRGVGWGKRVASTVIAGCVLFQFGTHSQPLKHITSHTSSHIVFAARCHLGSSSCLRPQCPFDLRLLRPVAARASPLPSGCLGPPPGCQGSAMLDTRNISWRFCAQKARQMPTCLLPRGERHGELWISALDPVLDERWLRERRVVHCKHLPIHVCFRLASPGVEIHTFFGSVFFQKKVLGFM